MHTHTPDHARPDCRLRRSTGGCEPARGLVIAGRHAGGGAERALADHAAITRPGHHFLPTHTHTHTHMYTHTHTDRVLESPAHQITAFHSLKRLPQKHSFTQLLVGNANHLPFHFQVLTPRIDGVTVFYLAAMSSPGPVTEAVRTRPYTVRWEYGN